MTGEIFFADKRTVGRTDVATHLRTIADRLEAGGPLTLEAGTDSVPVEIPAQVSFEVTVERESPDDDPGDLSLELELQWDENASDDSLSIQ
jgi:amphi-Trp domain-containing protein